MPAGRVLDENEIYLNGRFYRIDGPVHRDLISHQPPKISIGAYTKDDNPIVSTITWTNLKRGLGCETIRSQEDYNKAYYASMPLLTTPITAFAALSSQIGNVGTTGKIPFFAPGTSARFYAISTAAVYGFSTAVGFESTRAIAAEPTDSTWGQLTSAAGSTVFTPYLVVAQNASGIDFGHGFPYANWSSNSTAMKYITIYRDQLWGMNSSNELFFTPTPTTTWSGVARLSVSTADVRGLLVGPSEEKPEALYAVSAEGLHLYDEANERFDHIPIALNADNEAGRAFISWQGQIYYSAGLAVARYTPGVGVESIGMDVQDGLPSDKSGSINSFAVGGRYLFAQVDNFGRANEGGIYRFYNNAWDQIARSSQANSSARYHARLTTLPRFSIDSNEEPRLLYTHTTGGANNIRMYNIPSVFDGPAGLSTIVDAPSTEEIILPWIEKDSDQTWLALQSQLQVTIPRTEQTMDVSYGLDYSTTFTTFGATTASGEAQFVMTTAASTQDTQGVAFNAIRFRLRALSSNAGGTGGAGQIRRFTFAYKKTFKPIYSFSFIVDMTEQYKGYTPQQIREELEAVSTTPTLVEFTFKDELSATNVTEQHWVFIQEVRSIEQTGKDYGKYIVTLAEAL